jgi:hypothetical protein
MANPEVLRDLGKIANTLSPESPSVRIRFGSVVSVQANTCTVTVAGSSTQISGVKWLTEPSAGYSTILMTDGADMFVLGQPSSVPCYAPTARRTTDQSIATGTTPTAISFSAADGDSQSHWSAAAPTLLTIKRGGRYLCSASVSFAGSTTPAGYRSIYIDQNATTTIARIQTPFVAGSNNPTMLTVVSPAVTLSAGDTLRLMALHTQGATINALGSVAGAVWLSATWVGE